MPQGICFECNEPLPFPDTYGYHTHCAKIAHERTEKEADLTSPYVIVDLYGDEIDRFSTREQAEDYLHRLQGAEIEVRG